jgi:hypothetical protein
MAFDSAQADTKMHFETASRGFYKTPIKPLIIEFLQKKATPLSKVAFFL